MRQKLMIGMVVLNGILAAANFATPVIAQILPQVFFNCCKTDGSGLEPFCCEGCCWFVYNCNISEDCRDIPS